MDLQEKVKVTDRVSADTKRLDSDRSIGTSLSIRAA